MDFYTAAAGSELGTFALGLIISGVVGGLVAGMLGVGGGIVVVPALHVVLGLLGVDPNVNMHVAVGTSLATIIPTSISSLRSHEKRGAVDWALLRRWVGPMVAGVLIGSAIAGYVRGETLTIIFAVVALIASVHFALGREEWRVGSALPTGPGGAVMPAAIGGVSTMMGIGGGTIGVPTMVLWGYPIHRAVGTASAFGLIISIPGTVGAALAGWTAHGVPPYSLGYVNLLGFLLIAPASYFAAPLGASIAHMTDRKRLRIAFAVLIALTAGRMLYDTLA
jgi:uncharacterized membrane protein YfcA